MNSFDPSELQVFLNDLYTWYADNTSRGRKRHRVPSWTEFAQWLGWNNSTLSSYMNGTRGQPALETVLQAAPRMWMLGSTKYEQWFEVCGYDVVIPLHDAKLRTIVLLLRDLDSESLEEIYDDIQARLQPSNRDQANLKRAGMVGEGRSDNGNTYGVSKVEPSPEAGSVSQRPENSS